MRRALRRPIGRLIGLAALLLRPAWGRAQDLAPPAEPDLHIVISLGERRLWVLAGEDTLLSARVAVASDAELTYQGRHWRFSTAPGVYTVLRKDSLPVWVPPDWHYYEVAKTRGWVVRPLRTGRPVPLGLGRTLDVRDGAVGVAVADSGFTPLPASEEIVFDGVLYIPPLGTRNREIPGELGRYRLALRDGVSLHGTPWKESIGEAVTHGCIRLADDDVEWLYRFVPVGTAVRIR